MTGWLNIESTMWILLAHIRAEFSTSNETYGSPRIAAFSGAPGQLFKPEKCQIARPKQGQAEQNPFEVRVDQGLERRFDVSRPHGSGEHSPGG